MTLFLKDAKVIKLIFKLFGSHHPQLKCSHLWGEILQLFNSAQQHCVTAFEMKNTLFRWKRGHLGRQNNYPSWYLARMLVLTCLYSGKSYTDSLITKITQDLGSVAHLREGTAQVRPQPCSVLTETVVLWTDWHA